MRTASTTAALLLFWIIVVPPEGWLDVAIGVGASLALALWSTRFLWPATAVPRAPVRPLRLLWFILVTEWRIIVSAIQVLRIVFDPRLPIAPEVIRQTVRFDSDLARVAYANAITVTPGTLTLDVEGDVFTVHALEPGLAGELVDGTLARDVVRAFGRGGAS
jgi:multicomponent Na+:H+ antiporter subunit E